MSGTLCFWASSAGSIMDTHVNSSCSQFSLSRLIGSPGWHLVHLLINISESTFLSIQRHFHSTLKIFLLSPSWEIKTLSVMALRSGVCKSILWSQVQIPQRFYNSWNAKIERSVEPERLLVFDVRSLVAALLNYSWQIFDSSLATFSFWSFRDGWGPLCKFLGVVQPRKPFPRYWALRMKILAESKESVASTNISSLHCPKYWTSLHNSQCSNLV